MSSWTVTAARWTMTRTQRSSSTSTIARRPLSLWGTHPPSARRRSFNAGLVSSPPFTRQLQDQRNATPRSTSSKGRFIKIVEVSARDGLQNISGPPVPTGIKQELVSRLLDAGLRNIEVGSFVRGDRVPQMADTPTLLPSLPSFASVPPSPLPPSPAPLSGIPEPPNSISIPKEDGKAHYPVLVPNYKGWQNLLQLEEEHARLGGERLTDEISVFVSASEAFSQANNGASISKVLSGLPTVISEAKLRGYRVRGYVSSVITCPFSGPTPPEQVISVAQLLLDMGCYEISLGDTTGEGGPETWTRLWTAFQDAGFDTDKLAAHCHDTFAGAVPSILALLPLGLKTIDSSMAGLGGCPYSPGATGNVATEDVVLRLHGLGYQTGVDLEKLAEAGQWLCDTIGVRNESKAGRGVCARKAARLRREAKAKDEAQASDTTGGDEERRTARM